jgi:hypothetical protein
MENTTQTIATNQIAQYVSERLASEPVFNGFVVNELKTLMRENPGCTATELLQEAVQNAYEVWDSYQEDLVYGY